MKTFVLALFALLSLAVTPAIATPVFLEPAACNGHPVVQGENLWTDAEKGLGVPDTVDYVDVIKAEVHRIEAANPGTNWPALTSPDTRFPGQGRDIVLIDVGQCIHGLKLPGDAAKAEQPAPPAAVNVKTDQGPAKAAPKPVEASTFGFLGDIPGWFWLLILAIIVAAIVLDQLRSSNRRLANRRKEQRDKYARRLNVAELELEVERELHNDPVTAGSPVLEGGVDDRTVLQHARDLAARGASVPFLDVKVEKCVRGTLHGILYDTYRSGPEVPHYHNGVVGYQLSLRIRGSATPVEMYLLQACANPVRTGELTGQRPDSDFRFVPEAQIVPAPEPQPAPEPAVPAEPAAPVVEGEALPDTSRAAFFLQVQDADGGKPERFLTKGVKTLTVAELAGGVTEIRIVRKD